jgi:hypothetical protein
MQFRLRGYSPQIFLAARAELFTFPTVRNLVHCGCDIVAVSYDGAPATSEWVARLDEQGVHLELLIDEGLTPDAA